MEKKLPQLRDSMSEVPFRIKTYFQNTPISVGTAFSYLYEGQVYLVTNWHNVAGREPDTLEPKSLTLAIPDRLRIEIPGVNGLNLEKNSMTWKSSELLLYKDTGDSPTKPTWFEHPQYRNEVDVVVIPIIVPDGFSICTANDPKLNLSSVLLRPSQDVFVLGFPRGMSGGAKFPVWKRGSIASEPDIDVDELPKILIDTATREGMSGSPVYVSHTGYYLSEEKYENGDYMRCLGEGRRFIGVYSGRVGNDNFLAQLGVVWKSNVIEEIIQAAQVGESSFDLSCSR
jgi:Trypsin-like peptidase domain